LPGWRGGYAGLRDVNSSESVQTQAADLPASGTRDNDSAATKYRTATLPRMLGRAGIRLKDAYRPAEACKVSEYPAGHCCAWPSSGSGQILRPGTWMAWSASTWAGAGGFATKRS